MAKFVVSSDYLDKTIPELKNIINNAKKFEGFAKEKNVAEDNDMYVIIRNQHVQAKEALKIVTLEAEAKQLNQKIAQKKLSYVEKWESK